MSFIKKGGKEIAEGDKSKNKAYFNNSAKNTSKFLYLGNKNPKVSVVPLIEWDTDFPGEDVVRGYNEWTIFFDNAFVEKINKENPDFKLRSGYNIPSITNDRDIDVGFWLSDHPEVFKNVTISSKFGNTKNITLKKVRLIPVLWLDKPVVEASENNDEEEEDNGVRILKITQNTVIDWLDNFYSNLTGRIKDIKFAINYDGGTVYSLANLGEYIAKDDDGKVVQHTYGNLDDYVGFTTRNKIVEDLAKFGIIVPEVPEEKKAELEKIENEVAAALTASDVKEEKEEETKE